jgi:hypothetical protein
MITADIAIEAFLLVTGKRKRSIQDTTRLSGMFICGYGPPSCGTTLLLAALIEQM